MIVFAIASSFIFDFRYLDYSIIPDAVTTLAFVCGFAFMIIKGYQKLSFSHIGIMLSLIGQPI
jgi:hypothetical protein